MPQNIVSANHLLYNSLNSIAIAFKSEFLS